MNKSLAARARAYAHQAELQRKAAERINQDNYRRQQRLKRKEIGTAVNHKYSTWLREIELAAFRGNRSTSLYLADVNCGCSNFCPGMYRHDLDILVRILTRLLQRDGFRVTGMSVDHHGSAFNDEDWDRCDRIEHGKAMLVIEW